MGSEMCIRDSLTVTQHKGKVSDIALSPQGDFIATAGWDGFLNLTRLASPLRANSAPPPEGQEQPGSIHFAPYTHAGSLPTSAFYNVAKALCSIHSDLDEAIRDVMRRRVKKDGVLPLDTATADTDAILLRSAARGSQNTHAYDSSCLLYTSPSPRDLSTSRMPSSA